MACPQLCQLLTELLDGLEGKKQQAELVEKLKRDLDVEGVGAVQEDLFLEWWFGTNYALKHKIATRNKQKDALPALHKRQWAEAVEEFKQENKKEWQETERRKARRGAKVGLTPNYHACGSGCSHKQNVGGAR